MCNAEAPEPGTIIEIMLDSPNWKGKKFTTINRPVKYDNTGLAEAGYAWILDPFSGEPCVFHQDHYKIVNSSTNASHNNGVDASLDRQRDANLESVFC